jgi:histidinol-phosphatase (PHP family)
MPFNFPLTDAHVHPDFSADASGSIDEYCTRALQIGLTEIIFTTHIQTNPKYPHENVMVVDGEQVPTSRESIMKYAESVWEARERYYNLGLMVKCGAEIDFYTEVSDDILRVFEDRLFEYRLAAVHRVDGCALDVEAEAHRLFERYNVPDLLSHYYELVKLAAGYRVFDSIAHLDYYRRCAPKEKLEDTLVCDLNCISDAFESLVEHGVGIEVNTSGVRRGLRDYFPSMGLLNEARRAGVQIRYLGSDAHSPEHLAHDFENGEYIVYETNIHDIHEG